MLKFKPLHLIEVFNRLALGQDWFSHFPGVISGPFTSNEMAEWFSAGYFTMNLSVRRGCDEQFSPLGKL